MIRTLVALLLALAAAVTPAWAADVGKIKRAQGEAFVQRGAQRLPATTGLALTTGDTLITGKTGRIALAFIDDTRFAIGPDSRIRVDKFIYDRRTQQGDSLTRVDRGSLAIVSGQIARSRRDAMKVRTPTTLLGVRGTKFVVTVP